jgi:hypothetical protein
LRETYSHGMQSIYKIFWGTILLLLSIIPFHATKAQRFLSVVFDKLPKDNQLYARDDNSEAIIPVSGIIEVGGFSHMSVVIFRDGVRSDYVKHNLIYTNGNPKTSFSMSPKIKAELSEYTFEVYACKAEADSFLMVKREHLVAGDFYLINGQSNAAATSRYSVSVEEYVNKFSRTIGRTPNGTPALTPADTNWMSPAWVTPEAGYWGRDLQRLIIETHKIPVCIINGAIPGTKIDAHLARNPNNPAEPSSLYSHLLYRTIISKATRIRAFFWYQGEEDAWSNPGAYPEKLDQLIKYWQIDYPMVDRFVIVQINVLDQPHYAAGAMREFQRQTKFKYPKTDHFAVMGLSPMEDGVHYTAEGYGKLAKQFFDFLGPKVYKSTLDRNIESPDIRRVFYSASRDQITLEFDEKQDLKWPNDTTVNGIVTRLQDQFFLDGNESVPASLSSWNVTGNRITLHLKSPSTATKLNYLPSHRIGYYPGPFLRNAHGLGAFSFHEFQIAPALNGNNLKTTLSQANTVQLSWEKGNSTSFILERKAKGENSFVTLKTFDASVNTFEDSDVGINMSYTYRLKSANALSESPYSESTIETMTLLATEPLVRMQWNAFPNPVNNTIKIEFQNPVTGKLILRSVSGKELLTSNLKNETSANMSLTGFSTGIYILVFRNKNGAETTQRMLKY